MKKGQIAAQPFIYIIGIIVTVLILTFGFRAITSIKDQADLVELSTSITAFNFPFVVKHNGFSVKVASKCGIVLGPILPLKR